MWTRSWRGFVSVCMLAAPGCASTVRSVAGDVGDTADVVDLGLDLPREDVTDAARDVARDAAVESAADAVSQPDVDDARAIDAPTDEAAVDALEDGAIDVARDAPADVLAEATTDVSIDVFADAPLDVFVDALADAPLDVFADAGLDAAVDAILDVALDAGADVSTDAARADAPDGEVVVVPRPIAPLSSSTVTSRRPTLRWRLPPGATGAHLELCRDRACAGAPLLVADVEGTSYQPASELPPATLFWRLRARRGGAVDVAAGPTWQLRVRARSAPRDTSWGATADFDGDGYAEVVVGAPRDDMGVGHVFVYRGGADGIATTPRVLLSPDGTRDDFGSRVESAGDVDGDGYADLMIGAYGYGNSAGRVYVMPGGPAGVDATRVTRLPSPAGDLMWFGASLAAAGDINGDGYGDVAVGGLTTGRAWVYFGGPSGLRAAPDVTLSIPAGAELGAVVCSTGDVNGDGNADLAVGSAEVGRVYVFHGTGAGLATAPSRTLTAPSGALDFGVALAGPADFDGDGLGDVAVGASRSDGYAGRVLVYPGAAGGVAATPAFSLGGPDGAGGFFGDALGACDANGDGFDELVVGAPGGGPPYIRGGRGNAFWYAGAASGLTSAPGSLPGTGTTYGYFGDAVAGANDLDGDGRDELLVGEWNGAGVGQAFVYFGATAGPIAPPRVTLTSPVGRASYGTSVR